MSDALMWETERGLTIRAHRQIGAAIRFARQHRGWRLADVGVQTGYSVSTLSRLETSRRSPTDLEQVRRVACSVGIPLDILGECSACGPVPGLRWVGLGNSWLRRVTCAAVSCSLQALSCRLPSWPE
jgi:transcriptional regulator with XRE-family HTH domain